MARVVLSVASLDSYRSYGVRLTLGHSCKSSSGPWTAGRGACAPRGPRPDGPLVPRRLGVGQLQGRGLSDRAAGTAFQTGLIACILHQDHAVSKP
jgi:hypothetical protein